MKTPPLRFLARLLAACLGLAGLGAIQGQEPVEAVQTETADLEPVAELATNLPEPESEPALPPRRFLIAALSPIGSDDYVEDWQETITSIRKAGTVDPAIELRLFGSESGYSGATREQLVEALGETAPSDELWLFLHGHATWDGRTAKFNLQGPDITDRKLADLLAERTGPTVIILACSSSGPWLRNLSAGNRVVVTATKSGNEIHYARFGRYFARALSDEDADLDEDGQTSVLEAFLAASAGTAEWYQTENRIATEHAMIDDTDDALATRSDWFSGVRAIRVPRDKVAADGSRAHQLHLVPSELEREMTVTERAERDALEKKVFSVRGRRADMEEEEYYEKLEALFLEITEIYRVAEERLATKGGE